MKKMFSLSLLFAGVLSLSLVAPFTSHAAETGETSIGEPPVAEVSALAPAIMVDENGKIVYSPEEPESPEPIEDPITIEEEEVVGGRSERISYLKYRRHEFGLDKPLREFAQYLIENEGWAADGWIYELLAEAYPGEDPYPAPESPEPTDEPIIDGFENFKAMFGGMRYLYPEMSLEEYVQMYVNDRTQHTTDPEGIAHEKRWVWTAAVELYLEEVANEVSPENWQYYDPEGLRRPFALRIEDSHVDYDIEGEPETEVDHGRDTNEEPEANHSEDVNGEAKVAAVSDYVVLDEPQIGYIVAKGDSLWKIAEKRYGDGKWWIIITNANIGRISNPNAIYAGQELHVPSVEFK